MIIENKERSKILFYLFIGNGNLLSKIAVSFWLVGAIKIPIYFWLFSKAFFISSFGTELNPLGMSFKSSSFIGISAISAFSP